MDLQKRLEKVAKIPLKHGSHSSQKAIKEACVMEAVAWVAGEEWSDHPQCACPVIGAFMRSWNDSLPDDETRARLLRPLIPKLVGSRSTPAVESKRSWLALDWLARVHAPAFLELAGLKDHAQLCRELGELCNSASAKRAIILAAAGAAAWAAARDAAGAAARAAARDAAGAAARDAAWAAAWAHAGAALDPTVKVLQASALELIDRMLLVTE